MFFGGVAEHTLMGAYGELESNGTACIVWAGIWK